MIVEVIEKLIFFFDFWRFHVNLYLNTLTSTISAILVQDHFDSERKLKNTNARSAFI